jgi:hypothetical protein
LNIPEEGLKSFEIIFSAPQKPYQVSVTVIKSTNFTVNWEIGSPRPGITTYTIKVITDIAQSKELNVVGK